MLVLTPDGFTPADPAGLADEDDLLLEWLEVLIREADGVPQSVIEGARAAFKRRVDEVSQPRQGGGTIGSRLLCLAELLCPSRQLDALTCRAAADVAAVAARARGHLAGDRPRRTPARTPQLDLHTA